MTDLRPRSFKARLARLVGLVGILALGACDTAQLFTPTSSEFDGAWVGQLTVSLRQPECDITRGGLRVKIENGHLYGDVRLAVTRGNFTGVVAEDGSIAGVKLLGVPGAADAEFSGQFHKTTASGEWKHKYCRGEWDLKKLR